MTRDPKGAESLKVKGTKGGKGREGEGRGVAGWGGMVEGGGERESSFCS